ncbi:MAG: methyltransferase domain-containing protein [Dehalococcoidia bacterium]|nr:methyltransferase domain-containing protein [Dehalococcoidia bacterium]
MLLFNYSIIVDPVLKDVRICVVELSGVKAGDWVLDVACGSGDQVFHYAQKGAIATGVDENPNMIELAEKNWERRRFNQATFDIASATELPFPDGYFDIVSISLALHEMGRGERNKAVSEMKRVVKKNGTLLFADFQVPLAMNFTGYLIKAVEFIAGRENHRCFRDYMAQGGLGQILKEANLKSEREILLKSGNIQIIKAAHPHPDPLPSRERE